MTPGKANSLRLFDDRTVFLIRKIKGGEKKEKGEKGFETKGTRFYDLALGWTFAVFHRKSHKLLRVFKLLTFSLVVFVFFFFSLNKKKMPETTTTEAKRLPPVFEESSQYQHWRFSPEQLWDIRNKSTEAAVNRVKKNIQEELVRNRSRFYDAIFL